MCCRGWTPVLWPDCKITAPKSTPDLFFPPRCSISSHAATYHRSGDNPTRPLIVFPLKTHHGTSGQCQSKDHHGSTGGFHDGLYPLRVDAFLYKFREGQPCEQDSRVPW